VTRKGNRYMAQIHFKNEHMYLGIYPTAQEAHEVYFRKSKELNGAFANPGGACV